MITLLDVKKSITELLKQNYGYRIYGKDVKEGYKIPSFFVELLPVRISQESVNYTHHEYTIKVTYFQQCKNEEDNLVKADEIRRLLGCKIKINRILAQVEGYEFDFVGSEEDILQISFNIQFYEWIQREEQEKAKELWIDKEWRK